MHNSFQPFKIQRLGGDYRERRSVRLDGVGCCCCCCCIQMAAAGFAGLVAAPLALNLGYLPVNRRCRWPVVLLVTLAAAVTGVALGAVMTGWWLEAVDNMLVYFAACGGGVLGAWAAGWVAFRHDAPLARALGMKPKIFKPAALAGVLGLTLGGIVISTILSDEGPESWEWFIRAGILATIGLGFAVGLWLVREDHRHNPYHPEPWLGRLVGGLVGANVAGPMALVIGILVVVGPFGGILISAFALLGAWSVWWSYRKARRVSAKCWRSPAAWACVADITIIAAGVFGLTGMVNWDWGDWIEVVITAGIGGIVCALLGLLAWRLPLKPPKWADQPLPRRCAACGQELPEKAKDQCSECGHVQEIPPKQVAWEARPFPLTFFHPLSTSPLLGIVAGPYVWELIKELF